MQPITIPASSHLNINGHLYPVAGSKRLLVMCHGFRSSHEHPPLQTIAKGLHAQGQAVLTFNSSDESEFYINHQVQDIKRIAAHFTEYSEIVLLAGSLGALNASLVTLEEPRITGLVTVNGFFLGAASSTVRCALCFICFALLRYSGHRTAKAGTILSPILHRNVLRCPFWLSTLKQTKLFRLPNPNSFMKHLPPPKNWWSSPIPTTTLPQVQKSRLLFRPSIHDCAARFRNNCRDSLPAGATSNEWWICRAVKRSYVTPPRLPQHCRRRPEGASRR